jgi:hypothetical protein
VRTGDKHALVIAARTLQAQFAARWTDLAPELMRIKDDARKCIRDRRQVLLLTVCASATVLSLVLALVLYLISLIISRSAAGAALTASTALLPVILELPLRLASHY